MILTRDFIKSATHGNGETWTREQLEILGVELPPKKGWLSNLIGKEVPDEVACRFWNAQSPKNPEETLFDKNFTEGAA
jgi:hypothetical protein